MKAIYSSVLLNLIKVIVSLLCASLIGLQKQENLRIAGIHTLQIIGIGTCFFMVISISLSPFLFVEPYRVAGNIMIGMLLFGVFVLLKEETTYKGILSAAMIWVTGTIGIAIGIGLFIEGIFMTILTFFLLGWLNNNVKKDEF